MMQSAQNVATRIAGHRGH